MRADRFLLTLSVILTACGVGFTGQDNPPAESDPGADGGSSANAPSSSNASSSDSSTSSSTSASGSGGGGGGAPNTPGTGGAGTGGTGGAGAGGMGAGGMGAGGEMPVGDCVPDNIGCHPITNASCGGQVCDWANGGQGVGSSFQCWSSASTIDTCEFANPPNAFCVQGSTYNPNNNDRCQQYCCNDGDCDSGTCGLFGMFASAPNLGLCSCP